MKIALANDHAGLDEREEVIQTIKNLGHDVIDFGTDSAESVNYPEYATRVARAVMSGEADRGILICGTGIGMSIVANKFPGIRCACCTDEYAARMSRAHNDANVLALRGREIETGINKRIIRTWLTTDFEAGRHANRLAIISKLEGEIAREICSKD